MVTAPVITIPEGVKALFSAGEQRAVGRPWRLLSVGTIEPRKDLKTVSAAVERLRAQGEQLEARVVGRHGWGEALPQALTGAGYLPEARLIEEYRAADVLVAASKMEGFDLPILEAMACGLPVIASDIPVHRELFGEAAILFLPGDAAALAESIRSLLTSPSRYAERRTAGLAIARSYTWEAAARRIHALYDQVTTVPWTSMDCVDGVGQAEIAP